MFVRKKKSEPADKHNEYKKGNDYSTRHKKSAILKRGNRRNDICPYKQALYFKPKLFGFIVLVNSFTSRLLFVFCF